MSNPYLGEIRLFAGNFAPQDWHFCDGSVLNIIGNEPLFSLLGTVYGGNGTTTFGLPDFRGRVGVNQGQGQGLTNRVVGQYGGSETVTLTEAAMPAHTHPLNTAGATATTGTAGPTVTFANTTGTNTMYVKAGQSLPYKNPVATTIASSGGNAGHNNLMPGMGLNYIICLVGLYPQFQ